MSVYRIQHQSQFFALSNDVVNDPRISFKAKGILAYLLSKPQDWKVLQGDIVKHGLDGRDSVRNGINELISAGYIKRRCIRGKDGRVVEWEYIVTEVPEPVEPESDEPEAGNPTLDNPTLQSTDRTKDRNPTNNVLKKDVFEYVGLNEKADVDDIEYPDLFEDDEDQQAGAEYQEHMQAIETLGRRLGFPMQPADMDIAIGLMADYSPEWLVEAMRRTEDGPSSSRCWRYVKGILRNFKEKGGPDKDNPVAAKKQERPRDEYYGVPNVW